MLLIKKKFFNFMVIFIFSSLFSNKLMAATIREVGINKTYKTIQSAINEAQAGDTVLVYSGTYTENILSKQTGLMDNYISLKANGQDVIINANGGTGISIKYHNYWIVDGFQIINSSGSYGGIQLYKSSYTILRNNNVSGSTSNSDFYIMSSPNVFLENNQLLSKRTIRNLLIGNSSAVIVRGNEMSGGNVSVQISAHSHNLLFEKNYIHSHVYPSSGEHTSFFLRDVEFAVVRNNIFEASVPSVWFSSILIKDHPSTPSPIYQNERHKIYNNIFINEFGMGIYFQGEIENSEVVNNIVIGPIDYFFRFTNTNNGNVSSNITIDNNIHYFYDTSWPGREYWNDNNSNFIDGDNNITKKITKKFPEKFFKRIGNKPVPYYELNSTSPAIDAGDPATTTSNAGDTDYNENPRISNIIDIGPFEYQNTMPAAPKELRIRKNTGK